MSATDFKACSEISAALALDAPGSRAGPTRPPKAQLLVLMNTSLEWAVAWSLVEKWTRLHALSFCLLKRLARQGHPKPLVSPYDQRSVMLTWARACFEQESLPALLAFLGRPP